MSHSFRTPTFKAANNNECLCLRNMSPQKLAELKTSDPFMFYSIPSIRNAALLNKDEDETILSGLGDASADYGADVITRKSRLSFEYHADKVLQDELGIKDEDFDSMEEDCDDEEDEFYSFILSALPRDFSSSSVPQSEEKDDDFQEVTYRVPTFAKKTSLKREVTPQDLSTDELELLKKQDPFLYYSIPSIRAAAVLNRLQVSDESDSQTVKRQSRLSFECHPDLLLKDSVDELVGQQQSNDDADESLILSFLESFR